MVEVTQTEQERLAEAHDLEIAESIDAPLFVDCLFGNSSLRDAINEFKSRCAAKLEASIIEHRRSLAAELLDSGLWADCLEDNTTRKDALVDFVLKASFEFADRDYFALPAFSPWTPDSVTKFLDMIYEEVFANGIH